jgi:hypothetical protein
MDLINSQFSKALEVDRLDLLFKTPAQRKKSKKKVVAPLILTFNPGNPPVKSWINEELTNLYQDPKMKKTFPNIDVVYRQNRNIRTRIMRNRYTKRKEDQNQVVHQQAGNFKLHSTRCKLCDRMEDGTTKWRSNKTKREYEIRRHYTCQTTFCVYLATCTLCQAQYIGQTINTMQKRHYGHRSEVKTAADGLGEHFHAHAVDMGLDLGRQMDDIMQFCSITIIASVEPNQPWSRNRLDDLESDLQDRVMCFEKHGGMNKREDRKRGLGS